MGESASLTATLSYLAELIVTGIRGMGEMTKGRRRRRSRTANESG
jgi:hypothetical protein